MMNLTAHTAVLIDAAATTATAILMIAARKLLYPYFGLESPLLIDVTSVAFIIYAAIIALTSRQPLISRATLLTIAGANVAYVVGSMIVLTVFWADMHAIGRGLIVAVALAVEMFAMLQFVAARRQPAAEPA